ncbi:MAG: hypothetical protein HKP53_09295 [Eudoraea sp.]|nr:hypothetical protein [Eudoraea sp.]
MKTQIIKVSTLVLIAMTNVTLANAATQNSNLELDSIIYLEEAEDTSLSIDTEAYLPEDFNPYADPANFEHVSYIEENQLNIDLGFNTEKYLPEGFSPYPFFFDIDSVKYIDENDMFELDFDTKKYLPSNFNADTSI